MKRAAAAAALLVLLAACGDDEPERDPKRWEQAMSEAAYYCAGIGVGGGDANAIYTDEFKACQRDNAKRIYAEGDR